MSNNNATQLRFYYNGIKAHAGAKLERAWFSGSADLIFIYRRDYRCFSREIREVLQVTNNSDIMTDYFETDCVRLEPSHPCFAAAFSALVAAQAKQAARIAKREAAAA